MATESCRTDAWMLSVCEKEDATITSSANKIIARLSFDAVRTYTPRLRRLVRCAAQWTVTLRLYPTRRAFTPHLHAAQN